MENYWSDNNIVKCNKCLIEKPIREFHYKVTTCKDCWLNNYKKKPNLEYLNRKYEQILKFRNIDKGIGYLHKDSQIRLIASDLKYGAFIEYDEAVKLYNDRVVTITSNNSVYVLFGKNKFVNQKIIFDSKYTCHYCGGIGFTIDHIVPKSNGGKYEEENLVCSCLGCNMKKKNTNYHEFIKSGKNRLVLWSYMHKK